MLDLFLYDILRSNHFVIETQSFFEWLGETLGAVIGFIIRAVRGVVDGLSGAVNDFLGGMAKAIGMNASVFSFVLLAIGLLLLYTAIRAFIRRAIVAGIVWGLLGLLVLSWVVR
ncbi:MULTISPECIES: hypothetical protein [Inquilinus]|uniref:MFS transporter n=1 Tax=Inquilinus ginsengisoli TaxID=363840 RepID=A0ABU1JVT4_9PROT|nr:hypothetical protein [Inquilinus ginsengisoli]MDR6292723.1 hypothetical protein [Inquilinus ginsengisoli]